MLKKETIEKVAKIESNPFIIHILNKQNINVKDLLMVMSLCGNKSNAEKIKNLVLPEIDSIKESEKPKKAIVSKPTIEKVIEPVVVEPVEIKTEEVTEEVVKTKTVDVVDAIEPIEIKIDMPINEPTTETTEVIEETVIEEIEKPKKKGGRKKKVVEETAETTEQ